MNILGDYRLSTGCNVTRWAIPVADVAGSSIKKLPNQDYQFSTIRVNTATARPQIIATRSSGDTGSSCFAAAISLETSNGIEISGLNAEEQSDISFLCNWANPQVTGPDAVPSSLECYVYYDAMIVLEENNVVKLIQ